MTDTLHYPIVQFIQQI